MRKGTVYNYIYSLEKSFIEKFPSWLPSLCAKLHVTYIVKYCYMNISFHIGHVKNDSLIYVFNSCFSKVLINIQFLHLSHFRDKKMKAPLYDFMFIFICKMVCKVWTFVCAKRAFSEIAYFILKNKNKTVVIKVTQNVFYYF